MTDDEPHPGLVPALDRLRDGLDATASPLPLDWTADVLRCVADVLLSLATALDTRPRRSNGAEARHGR